MLALARKPGHPKTLGQKKAFIPQRKHPTRGMITEERLTNILANPVAKAGSQDVKRFQAEKVSELETYGFRLKV